MRDLPGRYVPTRHTRLPVDAVQNLARAVAQATRQAGGHVDHTARVVDDARSRIHKLSLRTRLEGPMHQVRVDVKRYESLLVSAANRLS